MLCRRFNFVLSHCKLFNARYANYSAAVLNFEDIPSPRGLPFVGSTFTLLASGEQLHEYLDKRHKELGPIFKDKVGPLSAVFLSDPDEMRAVFAQEGKYPLHMHPDPWLIYNKKRNYTRGLIFMDGEEWLHFRRIMNKLLLKGDLSWIENSCDVAADIFLNRILSQNEEGREFPNLEQELYKWAMDTIVSILLGADEYKQNHKVIEPLVKELASTVHLVFENTVKLMLLPARLADQFNIPRWKRFESSVDTTLSLANEIIDFLRQHFRGRDGLLYKMQEENIDQPDIDRIVADLILGAGDTTTLTMEWVLYLVSKNKEVQQKIRQNDETYLRNILRETLRLYPVVPFLNRILPDNAIISGYNIPAGTTMFLTIYTSGRDPKYFKNPEQFLPDRWLRDNTHSTVILQKASLPFAVGVRSCVGKKIAETQVMTTLSKIVNKFDVELCNVKEIKMDLQMISKPSEELRLKFHKI